MALFCTILLVCLVLILACFMYGPYIIEAAVEKVDQWADIIEAFKEEKNG